MTKWKRLRKSEYMSRDTRWIISGREGIVGRWYLWEWSKNWLQYVWTGQDFDTYRDAKARVEELTTEV